MPKVSKTIFATLLVFLNYTKATYRNLIYNAPSVAWPGADSDIKFATDRVLTHYGSSGGCCWGGYLFMT